MMLMSDDYTGHAVRGCIYNPVILDWPGMYYLTRKKFSKLN
jgi:hypothetical protein